MMTHTGRRKLISTLFVAFCGGAVLLALVPLALVLFFVISQGIQSLNWAFFTHMPTPVGEAGGGMANAIVGTLILSGLAAAMAVPIGVISGSGHGNRNASERIEIGAHFLRQPND